MCQAQAIIAGIGAAIQIGSTVLGAEAEKTAYEENKDESLRVRKDQLITLGIRKDQERQIGSNTILVQDRQARAIDAMARVSAGEAGVAGASVDALLDLNERDRLTALVNTKKNTAGTLEQLDREALGIDANARNRIAQVQKPSWVRTGLAIGGGGLNGASSYMGSMPSGGG